MFWENNKKFDFLTGVLRFSIISENGSYGQSNCGLASN